jgi:hypothetical protein
MVKVDRIVAETTPAHGRSVTLALAPVGISRELYRSLTWWSLGDSNP